MASDLTKKQLLELTGIAPGQLQTLTARSSLPFSINQTESGRGYSCFEAYLLLLADQLASSQAVTFVRSVDVVAALPPVMVKHWVEICRSGRLIADGTDKPVREVHVGRVAQLYPDPPFPICGTGKEIEAAVAAAGVREISSIRISASRVMSLLLIRARRSEIRIAADFGEPPFKYRPRPAAMTPQELAAAIEEKRDAQS